MTFWRLESLALEAFRPGINSIMEAGESLNMVFMEIASDMEDPGHTHDFEQCGVIVEGEMEMSIGDERRTLRAGEAYFVPAGKPHGWRTFEGPVRILDVSAKP
jgi:quercetin dioxygenase-like cupin family protein